DDIEMSGQTPQPAPLEDLAVPHAALPPDRVAPLRTWALFRCSAVDVRDQLHSVAVDAVAPQVFAVEVAHAGGVDMCRYRTRSLPELCGAGSHYGRRRRILDVSLCERAGLDSCEAVMKLESRTLTAPPKNDFGLILAKPGQLHRRLRRRHHRHRAVC